LTIVVFKNLYPKKPKAISIGMAKTIICAEKANGKFSEKDEYPIRAFLIIKNNIVKKTAINIKEF
jgi:hypothetical protein